MKSQHTRTRNKLSCRRNSVVTEAHSQGLSNRHREAWSSLRARNAKRSGDSEDDSAKHIVQTIISIDLQLAIAAGQVLVRHNIPGLAQVPGYIHDVLQAAGHGWLIVSLQIPTKYSAAHCRDNQVTSRDKIRRTCKTYPSLPPNLLAIGFGA